MLKPLATNTHFDELVTSLSKLDALLEVASHANILELETETALNYLWVINEVLAKMRKTCEALGQLTIYADQN